MLIERLMNLALLGSEWVLYLLLILSVISISTMVERWIYFLRRGSSTEKLRLALIERLNEADVAGAQSLVQSNKTVQARLVQVALEWLPGGPEALTDAVDAEIARIRADLEKGSNFLGTLGNNAPFVGLFGTVLGVIIAFHALGDSGGNTDAMGGVMAGIAEALVATGVGLFVAIPAVVAYNLIQKKIGTIEAEASTFIKLITAYAKADPRILERARELKEQAREESEASEEQAQSGSSPVHLVSQETTSASSGRLALAAGAPGSTERS